MGPTRRTRSIAIAAATNISGLSRLKGLISRCAVRKCQYGLFLTEYFYQSVVAAHANNGAGRTLHLNAGNTKASIFALFTIGRDHSISLRNRARKKQSFWISRPINFLDRVYLDLES